VEEKILTKIPNKDHLQSLFNKQILEVFFAVNKQTWLELGEDRRKAMELLQRVFPKEELSNNEILKTSFVDVFLKSNASMHCDSTTKNVSKFRKRLEKIQGIKCCTLCGSDKDIEVDHIVPVNQGGDIQDINNMQLLCSFCNTAKGSLKNDCLTALFQTSDTLEKFSSKCQFLYRTTNSKCINGRSYGICNCGKTTRESQIYIELDRINFQYSFFNITTKCNYCK
jgi:hypothetical protein